MTEKNEKDFQAGFDAAGSLMTKNAVLLARGEDPRLGEQLLKIIMREERFGNAVRCGAAVKLFGYYEPQGKEKAFLMRRALAVIAECGEPQESLDYMKRYYTITLDAETYYNRLVDKIFGFMQDPEFDDETALIKYVFAAYAADPENFTCRNFKREEISEFLSAAERQLPLPEAMRFILCFFTDRNHYDEYLTVSLVKILYKHLSSLPEGKDEVLKLERELYCLKEMKPSDIHDRIYFFVQEKNQSRKDFRKAAGERYNYDMERLKDLLNEINTSFDKNIKLLNEIIGTIENTSGDHASEE